MYETKCYSPDRKARKKLIRKQTKASLKTAKGSVKFCYGATKVLQALSVILCAINICWAVSEPLDLLLLFITFGMPFGLSFLPATVYLIALAPEYKFRKNERLAIHSDGFGYGFIHDRAVAEEATLVYSAKLTDITEIKLDPEKDAFIIRGNISQTLQKDGDETIRDNCTEIDIPNIFGIDLCDLIKK